MITPQLKKEIIQEILQSDEFCLSEKCQKIFNYLLDASIKGESIKESSIAIHLFGKDATHDPSTDSTIRAYISNLRKKLAHYYLTVGKENPYHVEIPKGHYDLIFHEYKSKQSSKFNLKKYRILQFLMLGVILILCTVIVYLLSNRPASYLAFKQLNDHPIWEDFLKPGKPILIVVGDYFVFRMQLDNEGTRSYIRDIRINSGNDLNDYLKNKPDHKAKITNTNLTFMNKYGPWSVFSILPIFSIKKEISLKLSSELNIEDLKRNNIIYVGSFKSLGVLTPIAQKLHISYNQDHHEYQIKPFQLTYFGPDSTVRTTYASIGNVDTKDMIDHAIVAKVPGYNDKTYLFFISLHEIGNIAAVKYFTDVIKLDDFESNFNTKEDSKFFESIFRVQGIERTDLRIELLHANSLLENFSIF